MDRAIAAAGSAGIWVHQLPYYSDGEFDESDTKAQREHIHIASANRALAMSDETRFAAAYALKRGIEFGVWRAMSDVWPTTLPPAARGQILESDGDIDFLALAKSLGADPEQIPALVQLGEDGVASIGALRASATAAAAMLVGPA